jgi:hypothetical protein
MGPSFSVIFLVYFPYFEKKMEVGLCLSMCFILDDKILISDQHSVCSAMFSLSILSF